MGEAIFCVGLQSDGTQARDYYKKLSPLRWRRLQKLEVRALEETGILLATFVYMVNLWMLVELIDSALPPGYGFPCSLPCLESPTSDGLNRGFMIIYNY